MSKFIRDVKGGLTPLSVAPFAAQTRLDPTKIYFESTNFDFLHIILKIFNWAIATMAAVENGAVYGNGLTNGSRPRTPSLNTLSLTEYSTNPSPPSASPRSKIRGLIPDEFILPNGYPDVFTLLYRK